jgi:hypothetical protein
MYCIAQTTMDIARSLLESHTQYAWVLKTSSFVATVTAPGSSSDSGSCLCVSNRDTHEIKPGTLFVDELGRGMVLIVPFGSLIERRGEPTHEIVFALTDEAHRRTGVLRRLMAAVPTTWHLWCEASSANEPVWRALGFAQRTHRTVRNPNVDWDDSIEMERFAVLSCTESEDSLPMVVLVK